MKDKICCLCQKPIGPSEEFRETFVRLQYYYYHLECSSKLPKCLEWRIGRVIKAQLLRDKDYGYRRIAKQIHVSKSTVHRLFKILSELRTLN